MWFGFNVFNANTGAFLEQIQIDAANVNVNDAPEPGTVSLFGIGLFGLAGALRCRMSK
jgi:hypothetical protein